MGARQAQQVRSSKGPAYVRCSAKGANSLASAGVLQTCKWRGVRLAVLGWRRVGRGAQARLEQLADANGKVDAVGRELACGDTAFKAHVVQHRAAPQVHKQGAAVLQGRSDACVDFTNMRGVQRLSLQKLPTMQAVAPTPHLVKAHHMCPSWVNGDNCDLRAAVQQPCLSGGANRTSRRRRQGHRCDAET